MKVFRFFGKILFYLSLTAISLGFFINFLFLPYFLPDTKFFGINIGGMTLVEAENAVNGKINNILLKKKVFLIGNKSYPISSKHLGVTCDTQNMLRKILLSSMKRGFFERIKAVSKVEALTQEKAKPLFLINKKILKENISGKIPNIFIPPEDAEYFLNEAGDLEIIKSKKGRMLSLDDLAKLVLKNLQNNKIIKIPTRKLLPLITTKDLKEKKELISKVLEKPIVFSLGEESWELNLKENFGILKVESVADVDFKEVILNDDRRNFKLSLSKNFLERFAKENFLEKIKKEPENIIFKKDENGNIFYEGNFTEGLELDLKRLSMEVNKGINEDKNIFELKPKKIPAKVIAQDISFEIDGKIAVGESSFVGSSAARIHNVKTGMSKVDGKIIMPGETFSFLKEIGDVTQKAGFTYEKVIADGRTRKEIGGGLCQVSTTIYRAALNAGFPIIKRKPHTFAVRYYTPYGLDATVYNPSLDFKFQNDSKSAVFVRGYTTDDLKAYFEFYGKDDGRKVEMNGPEIRNHRKAGKVIKETTDLKPGVKVTLENPVNGFDTLWNRKITYKNGDMKEEEIFSRYKAWPMLINVGVAEKSKLNTENTEKLSKTYDTGVYTGSI